MVTDSNLGWKSLVDMMLKSEIKRKFFAKKIITKKNRSSELLRANQNTQKSEAEAWPI